MRKSNVAALVLLLMMAPVFVMGYMALWRDVRRDVALHHGTEILNRVQWFQREYKRAPYRLYDAAVPEEDRRAEVHYWMLDSTAFHLAVMFGAADSVVFDSKVGEWR